MPTIRSKTLFFTTSPRSPERMVPEIKVLGEHFSGKPWDTENQRKFMYRLREEETGEEKYLKDPAFSARDRINRAPKALGFVDLDPCVSITPPGRELIREDLFEEVLLRQLMKFQIPSPYHRPGEGAAEFWVKPYLEILRLIRRFGSITFDELMLFGMQLTDYRRFDEIAGKIERYREEKSASALPYKKFLRAKQGEVIREIYAQEMSEGRFRTRESSNASVQKFMKTKISNLRDYSDACVRYLRAAGAVSVSRGIQSSLSVAKGMEKDVDFLLDTVGRDPVHVDEMGPFKAGLFDPAEPPLYSDDRGNLISGIVSTGYYGREELAGLSVPELKRTRITAKRKALASAVKGQEEVLRTYSEYASIMSTYDTLSDEFDPALILEWNTWRAMAMLDDGKVEGNFVRDDAGEPRSTAGGNMPDIVCEYPGFNLVVEVTMQNGKKQYESEGESVVRHLGDLQVRSGKTTYGLFIAPRINESVIAYFFSLNFARMKQYGGLVAFIPLSVADFKRMLESAERSRPADASRRLRELFEFSVSEAKIAEDEGAWYESVRRRSAEWLSRSHSS